MEYNLELFLKFIWNNVQKNKVGPGTFSRIPGGAPDPYGCADAANIAYTLDRFPIRNEQEDWIRSLQSFQDPETGLFYDKEGTHHPYHTTAHCCSAIELFDLVPLYPIPEFERLKQQKKLEKFLESLDWKEKPWSESHKGAGVYAAMITSRNADIRWQNIYFRWLWHETDPETGLWRKNCINRLNHSAFSNPTLFPHLAGTFHYLFNLHYAKRPLRFPEKLVDTCLMIYKDNCEILTSSLGFSQVDWVFTLTKAVAQSGYKYGESVAAVRDFTGKWLPYLFSLHKDSAKLNDLHYLFGILCGIATIQQVLPGEHSTERPLRLVLDRRPFI
jgi:hypothetical protein